MRIFFFVLFLTCLILSQLGCNGNSANQSGSNSQTSTANTQSTPLPAFTDADTAYAEGNKLFDANKNEMAIEAYNQAVKLNPDFADAWFKLGIAYSLIEKQNEIDSLNEEVQETPTPTPAKKTKKDAPVVRTKDSEKAFEKAVAAYKKIIEKNEEDDAAFYNLGRAYNKLDEDEDAEKALRQAVKLKPDDTLYQTELGTILIKLARYDEAVKALKKALEIDPENSEAEELLDKAEAGKKRIDFGVTPKTPPLKSPKPTETETPATEGSPESPGTPVKEPTKPAETKPPKTPEKKLDKKGDQ